MPPRWSKKPDRNDPEYRRLEDRINFVLHFAIFSAINSGLWFFHIFKQTPWSWLNLFTEIWLGIVLLNVLYITVIADYSQKNYD